MTVGLLTAEPEVQDVAPPASALAPAPAPVAPRRRRWVRWTAGALALSMFGAALGYVVRDEVAANGRFALAQHELTVTDHELGAMVAELATLQQQLAAVNDQVSQTNGDVSSDTSQLESVRAAIVAAQGHLVQQGRSIVSLQSCLDGVEQALNALSVGDDGSAIAALNGGAASCQSAVASDG
jgi:hypothetical protein